MYVEDAGRHVGAWTHAANQGTHKGDPLPKRDATHDVTNHGARCDDLHFTSPRSSQTWLCSAEFAVHWFVLIANPLTWQKVAYKRCMANFFGLICTAGHLKEPERRSEDLEGLSKSSCFGTGRRIAGAERIASKPEDTVSCLGQEMKLCGVDGPRMFCRTKSLNRETVQLTRLVKKQTCMRFQRN